MIFHDGRAGRVYVVDLNSSHGVHLEGNRVDPLEPQLLREGSKLRFGGSQVCVFVVTLLLCVSLFQ